MATDAGSTSATGGSDHSSTNGQICGNGLVEEEEECDDGNQEDNDSCLSTCVSAYCGDGYVQVGIEQCDDGDLDDDDGCISNCAVAYCGDAFVRMGEEECDDGDLQRGDGCSEVCENEYIVFVTNGKWFGNFESTADGKCKDEAKDAGLTGEYVAWICAFSIFRTYGEAWKALPSGEPLILTTGDKVVDKAEDLALGENTNLLMPINRDALGGTVLGLVWTGTKAQPAVGGDCEGWESKSALEKGVVGHTDSVGPGWTDAAALSCDNALHLYCFRRKD